MYRRAALIGAVLRLVEEGDVARLEANGGGQTGGGGHAGRGTEAGADVELVQQPQKLLRTGPAVQLITWWRTELKLRYRGKKCPLNGLLESVL